MADKILFNLHPWCTCIQTGKWHRQDGFRRAHNHNYKDIPNLDLWVHPRCNKPSKMTYDRLILGLQPLVEENRHMRFDEDIVALEAYLDAKKEIKEILDWDEIDESWEELYDPE